MRTIPFEEDRNIDYKPKKKKKYNLQQKMKANLRYFLLLNNSKHDQF